MIILNNSMPVVKQVVEALAYLSNHDRLKNMSELSQRKMINTLAFDKGQARIFSAIEARIFKLPHYSRNAN